MNIKNYIEMGEKKAGKQVELARILGINDSYIRTVKSGRNGLPDAICFELADYIGVDKIKVIAASNLVTEKNEGRRKIYERCLSVSIALTFSATLIVTPMPANASTIKHIESSESHEMYIM